jgi:hypothetical protein
MIKNNYDANKILEIKIELNVISEIWVSYSEDDRINLWLENVSCEIKNGVICIDVSQNSGGLPKVDVFIPKEWNGDMYVKAISTANFDNKTQHYVALSIL